MPLSTNPILTSAPISKAPDGVPPELADAIQRASKPSRLMAKRIRGVIRSKALIVLTTVTVLRPSLIALDRMDARDAVARRPIPPLNNACAGAIAHRTCRLIRLVLLRRKLRKNAVRRSAQDLRNVGPI